ncbi:MAG: ParB/RepB/Spo0J family partition protein [Kocuria sp.]|nr:ParB/RepB/Spo0J family partition protein [Kocuria sp.]MDN5617939.1 ParB/RepB/Spo0J family partition protein [Kocuria sp.]
MGAALRKSAGGRRPVDFFFQPSESSSVEASVPSTAPDEQGESPKAGERANAASAVPGDSGTAAPEESTQAGTNPSVSRETVQGSADPSPRDRQEDAESGEAEGATLIPVPGAHFGEIPVSDIHPNRKQPRQEFDEDEMEELVHSIREIGLLQPIVIRPSQEEGDAKYELVMGERRWRATQRAGLETIPSIVRQTQDVDLLRDALLENLHRSQLNPLEEAAAYQQLLNEFGTTQDELALKIGRSRPQISNTIRLLRLPALVQRRVAAGILSAGHARALLALTDPAAMERLAQRIVAEGLSVRSVEEIIQSGAAEKGEQKPRKPATPNKHHERLDYIADAFSDKLDTNVKINLGARKGKMTIEFASVDDLNRIITVLDPKIEGE